MTKHNPLTVFDFCGTLVDKITSPDFVRFAIKDKYFRYIIYKLLSNRFLKLLEPHYFLILLNKKFLEKKTLEYSTYLISHLNHSVLERFLQEKNKIIISAGFEDIIVPLMKRLCIDNYTIRSNKFYFFKDFFIPRKRIVTGKTKINYLERSPDVIFTDSLDDIELIKLSKTCFFVSNEVPRALKNKKNVILFD